jgi:hypothetical protein
MGRKSRMKKERRKAKNNLNKHQKELTEGSSRADFEMMDRSTESLERLLKSKGKKEDAMGLVVGKKMLQELIQENEFDRYMFIYQRTGENQPQVLAAVTPRDMRMAYLELLGFAIAEILEERFYDTIPEHFKHILSIAGSYLRRGLPQLVEQPAKREDGKEIRLNIKDDGVEVVWSEDLTPEQVVKYLTIIQKQLIVQYCSDPRDLISQITTSLMEELEAPITQYPRVLH